MQVDRTENQFRARVTVAICLVLCLAVSQVPVTWQQRARLLILESSQPVMSIRQWMEASWMQRESQLKQDYRQLQERYAREKTVWEQTLRKRDLALAHSSTKHRRDLVSSMETDQLLGARLVSAELLSRSQIGFLRHQLLIQTDDASLLREDERVLLDSDGFQGEIDRKKPLIIDHGSTSGLQLEQPVFSGQCIVGSLEDVGAHLSRVRLVTDARYRGRARILRKVEDGFAYGPEGVLEGNGSEFCTLRFVSKTESIRVGDDVYSSDPMTSSSAPMYYGRIVEATLDPNDHEWSIRVEPGFDPVSLDRLRILIHELNLIRPVAN